MANISQDIWQAFGKMKWVESITYDVDDLVQWGGSLWKSVASNINVVPGTDITKWEEFSSGGVGDNISVTGNIEITDTGWAIFPNRTGLGTVPNLTGDTLQVTGGMAVEGGMKQMLGDGTVTNVWYTSGSEDINIVRNFNNVATLWSVRSNAGDPTTDDREATLALVRTDDAGNEEFVDFFANGYHSVGEVEHGVRIQKRGTGLYRDFMFQFSDGTVVDDAVKISPDLSTTFYGNIIGSDGLTLYTKTDVDSNTDTLCQTIANATASAITNPFTGTTFNPA